MLRILVTIALVLAAPSVSQAAEICGNGQDDDGDSLADESCASPIVSGICESPLSCGDTGVVSPISGALHYALPPDISPRVPWGPGIGVRRTYMSQYAPGGGAPAYRKAMGERWHMTYMTWLDRHTGPDPDQVVVHTSRGLDVLFSLTSTTGGWDTYSPPAGYKSTYSYVRQRQASPNEYQLRTLTGETVVYDSVGKVTEIWDTLANKVLVAYDGNGMVSTVTDAQGKRRLLFGYASSLMTSAAFQIYISGAWSTQHTTTYSYASGNLTSVSIGGASAQAMTYSSNYLTAINDAAGNNLVTFSYDAATAGKVVRVDTPRGMVGFEYNSGRTACSGKTVLHFNRGNTSSCNVDSDCGSGFLCGGKTGAGSTGQCFRAARCLTVSSPNEDLITSISALGPPSESCEGTCLDVLQYVWDTAGGALNLKAVQDPSSNYTAKVFNSSGLPTRITYGDDDADASDGPKIDPLTGALIGRETFLFYDTNFPGRVTETRHLASADMVSGTCTATSSTYCARTLQTWNATTGLLDTVQHIGYTLDSSGSATTYNPKTTYSYDSQGRVTQILTEVVGGSVYAKTTFHYYSSADPLLDGFIEEIRRYKDATNYITSKASNYDFWGNPGRLIDPNDVITCLTFDSARGYLAQRRVTMAAQTDCTANGADLVTAWERDSALRLTKLTRPDGSCMIYEYDTKGRLSKTKRRDDCNGASSGDREEYTYSPDGLLTKIETFNASSTVTKRQELSYFDSRRLEKLINPVDASKWTGFVYDNFGLVSEVNGGGNLNKTKYERASVEARVTTEKRYRDATNFDSWNLLYDWLGSLKKVTDGDSKITYARRDDRSLMVKLENPDLGGYPTLRVYDPVGRLETIKESFGGVGQQTHAFTYDRLGRTLTAQYHGTCPSSSGAAEIQYTYDAPPGSCPVTGSCLKTAGRLAYVKITLMCDAAKADKTLDQETWYSYDAAGRVIKEHIRDDNSRVADHEYAWTKNGALQQTTTPAGVVIGATFGSAGSNSDTDRITALWRVTTGTPVIDNILWEPYGPLKQYNQMNTVSGTAHRTKITRNLAYRIDDVRVERQDGTNPLFIVDTAEDAAGRITKRDYSNAATGVQDSFFLYDYQDRVLCETTTSVGSCPTTGSPKNSHTASPPFTAAGDWKWDLRATPGTSCRRSEFSFNTGTHQINSIDQSAPTPCVPQLGLTEIGHDSRGNRSYDDNTYTINYDSRDYTYDARRNVTNVRGQYYNGGYWDTYDVASAFDHQNRRVFKSHYNHRTTKLATWFFYYDALDRLVEIRYTPDTSASSTYSVFQLFWLGDRLVLYWQTDYPSVTTSKRYVGTDESGRPVDMWSWPASGDTTRVWAINPSAWGMDVNKVGPTVFQPILFAGQYQDVETVAWHNNGTTLHRPGLALNGFRTYDPFTGSYLQVDPLVDSTWSTYVYVDSNPVGNKDSLGLAVDMGNYGVKVTVSNWGGGFTVGCDYGFAIEGGGCTTDPFSAFGVVTLDGLPIPTQVGPDDPSEPCPDKLCERYSCRLTCCSNPEFSCHSCEICKEICLNLAHQECDDLGPPNSPIRECCILNSFDKCIKRPDGPLDVPGGVSCNRRCDCDGAGQGGAGYKCTTGACGVFPYCPNCGKTASEPQL